MSTSPLLACATLATTRCLVHVGVGLAELMTAFAMLLEGIGIAIFGLRYMDSLPCLGGRQPAGSTLPTTPSRDDVCIGFGELMAMFAVSLCSIGANESFAPKKVLFGGDWFQVVRVHTSTMRATHPTDTAIVTVVAEMV